MALLNNSLRDKLSILSGNHASRQGIHYWQRWFGQGLNLLFPPQCIACKKNGYLFCPHCSQEVRPLTEPLCFRCGRPQLESIITCAQCERTEWLLRWARAAARFAMPLQSAIHALKYDGKKELAAPLARYLVATYRSTPWHQIDSSLDMIIPVPLHPKRLQDRGYNQAQLLAESFGEIVQKPVKSEVLLRRHFASSQVGLDFDARQANVAGAFQVQQDLSGMNVLILDDVYTTGATLNACANALQEAGAAAVYGLTLAMAGYTDHARAI
ncbi:MAG: ComF family protein [Chloroflexota bacterium]